MSLRPSEHLTDYGVADLFLAGRTDALPEDLERLFRAASSAPTAAELSGATAVMEAFLDVGPGAGATLERELVPTPTRGPLRRRILATALVSTLLVTGLSAAAYAGALPGPLQTVADRMLGEPLPTTGPTVTSPAGEVSVPPSPAGEVGSSPTAEVGSSPTGEVTGPAGSTDADGPAAPRLCTAYAHGGLAPTSVGYATLVAAAGGVARVDRFCAEAGVGPSGDAVETETVPTSGRPSPHTPAGASKGEATRKRN